MIRKILPLLIVALETLGFNALAHPYASGLTNNNGTISWVLNEPASDVQIIFDSGTVTNDLGASPIVGTNFFALGTHTNFAIMVQKAGSGSLNQISSDANVNNSFPAPHGVAVNKNARTSNFGCVYVANAGTGAANNRTSTSSGVYVMDAASGDIYGRGNTAATAGITFGNTSSSGFSPNKLFVGSDDSVYVGDSGSGNIGGVWQANAELSTSTKFFGLAAPATNSATRGTNFGRFVGTPNVTGSLAAGNLSLYAVEWDLDLCNPPGTYAPSANGYNGIYQYYIGAELLPWKSYPTVITNPISIGVVNTVTMDAEIAPDGKFFICALRYNTADTFTNVCVLSPTGTVLWDSRTQSRQYFGDSVSDHLSISDTSIAVSPDEKYVVIQGSTNNNFMLMSLTNGVPDISTLTTNTVVGASGGTWCYSSTWDAADNIYVTSAGSETLRIFSLGLSTTCITSNDWTCTNGSFQMLSTASPAAIQTQPASQSVACGGNAVFTVGATGSSLSYQWFENNVLIGNATGPALTLQAVPLAESGESFSVVVSNSSGSVTSQPAVLTVTDSATPSITLIGNASTNVLVDSGFSDPGAVGYDACAGLLPVTTNGTVNMNAPGAYVITYTATDPGNNSVSVSRTVTVTGVAGGGANATPSIIPLPVTMQVRPGVFTLCPTQPVAGVPAHPLNTILVDNVSLATGQYLARQLFKSTGFQFQVATNLSTSAVKRAVLLTTQNAVTSLGTEGYELTVAPDSVVIRAPAQAGLFYGVQSFFQLLPPAILSPHPVAGVVWTAPCVYIEDQPQFSWRGVMLDVARHFFSVQEVKQVLDAMALHKLNTFHWHLVDDQGWRLQITNYPNLTVAGAFRGGIDYGLPPRASTATNSSGQYGGFYTQADALDIVAYATERHITVVPEIEMPCHSTAGLAAYPQFGCGDPVGDYNMDYPNINYGVDLYSLAAPGTMAFFEDVLTEVMGIFPSKYIHCGGDEVVASGDTQWNSYSYDKAQMQALGITPNGTTSIVAYQHWLSTNLANFIQSQGRVMMGWTEFENGGVLTNAALSDWETGSSSKAVAVAEAGQPVVMSPDNDCYINYVESSNTNIEPPFIVGGSPSFLSVSTVYNFSPIPSSLPAQYDTNILGAQCNLWCEYVPSFENVMFKMFPRVSAMAELTWTPPALKNYASFTNRLNVQKQRLTAMGVNYDHESIPQIGTWGPSVYASPTPMTWTITTNVAISGEIDVNFLYTSGADGLAISSVALLQNGVQVDIDTHAGFAGVGATYTLYVLHLPQAIPGANYAIQATVSGRGGTASSGIVYLPNWN